MRKHQGRYGYTVMEPMQGNVKPEHFVGNLKPCSKAMPNGDGSDASLTGARHSNSRYISISEREMIKNKRRPSRAAAPFKKEGKEL